MLNPDLWPAGEPGMDSAELPGFARALATVQVESAADVNDWQELGCPRHDLVALIQWIDRKHELLEHAQEGPDRLSDAELALFKESLGKIAGVCRQLQSFNLPDTLVHKGFRPILSSVRR
jgi:hypothetical protein